MVVASLTVHSTVHNTYNTYNTYNADYDHNIVINYQLHNTFIYITYI